MRLPCGSGNLLRLGSLWIKSGTLRLGDAGVSDQLVHAAEGAVAVLRGGFLGLPGHSESPPSHPHRAFRIAHSGV